VWNSMQVLSDLQSVWWKLPKGMLVFASCSHSGARVKATHELKVCLRNWGGLHAGRWSLRGFKLRHSGLPHNGRRYRQWLPVESHGVAQQ
jgi:hypothetical protein